MTLWAARISSLQYLQDEKPEQLHVLMRSFSLIDVIIDEYEAHANNETYAKVCALALLKVKNLSIGTYSLVLDGLGQEAGALLRPFVEYVELLTYFRAFPEKAALALTDELPNAGKRAKAINGMYRGLRDYLNSHASHSSFSSHSLGHLVEVESARLRKLQQFVPTVLERNIRDFAIQMFFAIREAVLGLTNLDVANLEILAAEADEIKECLLRAFALDKDI